VGRFILDAGKVLEHHLPRRGEFVGGADIVRELHSKGELATMIAKATEPQSS
jgi:hypothetical protein